MMLQEIERLNGVLRSKQEEVERLTQALRETETLRIQIRQYEERITMLSTQLTNF